jgi:hypothetical protein
MSRFGLRQGLAQAGMRQAEIVVELIEHQLVAQAILALTERHDAPSHGCHMLADRHVDALDEGGVNLPARRCQRLLDSLPGTEDDPVADACHTPAPVPFDHLCIEQRGQRHPSRLGG